MQLRGPVPADLYHRYVEFKPFVAGMFNSQTLRGRLLNRALHHQHARIYNYDRSTKYGVFQEPSVEMTKLFLDFVHYAEGGRIFTYVLTLDGQLRFTETGKEFGIDLLSKHTMHSDVSIYIAFSGEFFIRRVKHPRFHRNDSAVDPVKETDPPSAESGEDTNEAKEKEKEHETDIITPSRDGKTNSDTNGRPSLPSPGLANGSSSSPPAKESDHDPSSYELIIDNDSGTYRPNAAKLNLLRDYLVRNLPGLKVVTLDCQADEEVMKKLKGEQRERKKRSGKQITYLQNSSVSSLGSLSSSDEEDLERRAEGGEKKEGRAKREMHKFLGGGKDEHHWPGDAGGEGGEGNGGRDEKGKANSEGDADGSK